MVIYLDRLQSEHLDLVINSCCIYRLLIASLVLAIKYCDDSYYKNSFYAQVGGISVDELNILERELYSLLDFKLYVGE